MLSVKVYNFQFINRLKIVRETDSYASRTLLTAVDDRFRHLNAHDPRQFGNNCLKLISKIILIPMTLQKIPTTKKDISTVVRMDPWRLRANK